MKQATKKRRDCGNQFRAAPAKQQVPRNRRDAGVALAPRPAPPLPLRDVLEGVEPEHVGAVEEHWLHDADEYEVERGEWQGATLDKIASLLSQHEAKEPALSAPKRRRPKKSRINITAASRVLALLGKRQCVAHLNGAVAGLLYIIEACGDGTTCVFSYKEAGKDCGVFHKTFKGWMDKLEKEEWVTRELLGPKGLKVRLDRHKFQTVDLFDTARSALADAEAQLEHAEAVAGALISQAKDAITTAHTTLT
jgi:hypothetical protein